MQHMFLPHCWVCEARFTSSNPPGKATEERHHIIPRAFGGEDGPQVSLCSEHHNKLHQIADCIPKKDFRQWLTGETPERVKKLLWLATRVVNSREAAKTDPNKHVLHSMLLDPELRKQIDALKPVVGVRARDDVIRYAIASLYKRTFVK